MSFGFHGRFDGGSVDVVQYLLDNGSDTETLIRTGLTPLVYAVGKGSVSPLCGPYTLLFHSTFPVISEMKVI